MSLLMPARRSPLCFAKSYVEQVGEGWVLAYMLSFANQCTIDLSATYMEKMKLNAKKYTIERAKSSFGKHPKLEKPVEE